MRSTAAPYTESRLARLVRNKRVGFPVVEHEQFIFAVSRRKLHLTCIDYGQLFTVQQGISVFLVLLKRGDTQGDYLKRFRVRISWIVKIKKV